MFLSFHVMVFEIEVYFAFAAIYNILFGVGGGGAYLFYFIKIASV